MGAEANHAEIILHVYVGDGDKRDVVRSNCFLRTASPRFWWTLGISLAFSPPEGKGRTFQGLRRLLPWLWDTCSVGSESSDQVVLDDLLSSHITAT